jgi:isopenicillin N synthase-like dioxygenase
VDYKESFVWGPELPAGDAGPEEQNSLRAPNLWPDSPPGFRRSVYPYLEQAQRCAVLLMGAFALALERPRDAFLRSADKPVSRASLTYYPAQPARLGTTQFGVGPHTDFGCLTVLCQDDVGGLQVLNAANEWVTAQPIPGTLVVNVGDLLARWSNGRFRSTPHRVVNSSGRERYSLVLAYDPNAETLIDPAAFLPEGETPRYPPITCGTHIANRFRESFSYKI